MSSESLENASNTKQISAYILPYVEHDNEVSLLKLWRTLAKNKWLILVTILIATAIAMIYLMITPPVYTAEARLLKPSINSVLGLQQSIVGYEKYGIGSITPDSVFREYVRNFDSISLRRDFFVKKNLKSLYIVEGYVDTEQTDRMLEKNFFGNLHLDFNEASMSADAGFSYAEADVAADVLNQYVAFVSGYTIREYINNINSITQIELANARNELSRKLEIAKQKRLDLIEKLEEALSVARELDLKSPKLMTSIAGQISPVTTVYSMDVPLYLHGAKALQANIDMLAARPSDEPFMEDADDLRVRIKQLESASIKADGMEAINIDMSAYPPMSRDKPSRKTVIALALALGLVVGLFLAFMKEFMGELQRQA